MCPLKTNDLHRIFHQLDKNGDGLLSTVELNWLLEGIGVRFSLEELESSVGKSCLSFDEFSLFYDSITKQGDDASNEAVLADDQEGRNKEECDLFEAFKVFDSNGDGFISCEELQSLLSKLGLWDEKTGKDCRSMICRYDTNLDGVVDFEEFKNMMLRTNGWHDSDVGDEDYRKYHDGSVRGPFFDSDAHLDTKSSSKKNNERYSGIKIYRVSNECTQQQQLDCDACVDIKSSSKRNVRSADNGNAVDLVIGLWRIVLVLMGLWMVGWRYDIVDDGHLNNGIVGEDEGDDGNNKDDGCVGDGADTNEDPDYKMFLDNLRQDGKSCILEIPLTNEISITVRYDLQDGAYDGCNIEKPNTQNDCPKRKNNGTTELLKMIRELSEWKRGVLQGKRERQLREN
ncbi:hypothetical protein NC652_005852 [Populus alba x Populus x berolinensis]|nr:hypothetical protein NC652_005852 [Populus alba x Populus x berolinensis]